MIGLIAVIVLGGLLLLAAWVFIWTYRAKRRKGKSDAAAFSWAVAAVLVLSLPITWDAIPTWIAFKYYAHKEAGMQVFKTLEQWKAENPGVAETLEPYKNTVNDKRMDSIKLTDQKSRTRMNDRFASDDQRERLFLSVGLRRREIVDTQTGDVLFHLVTVGSGNSGGLAQGGVGWWKPWLVHGSSTETDRAMFDKFQNDFHFLGSK